MSVDPDLSDAVVRYVGYGAASSPSCYPSSLVPKFGEGRGRELEQAVESLLAEIACVRVDWASHSLASGAALARDAMQARHPGLSAKALDALAWKFSCDWK